MNTILRVAFTVMIVFGTGAFLAGHAVSSGRTAADLQVRRGYSADKAWKRAMIQGIVSAAVVVGSAVFALVLLWRKAR